MTDSTDRETGSRTDRRIQTTAADGDAVQGVGTYESGDGVVFYDSENPLAWVKSGKALHLEEMV